HGVGEEVDAAAQVRGGVVSELPLEDLAVALRQRYGRQVVREKDDRERSDHEQRRVPERQTKAKCPPQNNPFLFVPQPPGPTCIYARRTYPTPRTVCSSFLSNGRSIFSRSRLTSTSTTLVCGSKLYSHTCDRIIVFDTTRPALRTRYSSSENSRGRRSTGFPPRVTRRDSRSNTRSSTVRVVGSGERVARRTSAWTRASSSANANGLVR